MRALMARLARCVLALGLLPAATGCGGGTHPGSVTIMVPWSGKEFRAFYSVIRQFRHDTGIRVDVQVTRALNQQLDAAVEAGAPPDLAMLPSVGAIYQYAGRGPGGKGRGLKPLDVDTGTYLQPFQRLSTVRGRTFAVPVKVDVKSLVWFNPRAAERPTSSADLDALSRKHPGIWCLGLESGPTSGWPGADWIADILLAEGNGDAYKQWLSGALKWNSDAVGEAWTTWRNLVGTSVKGASTRKFGEVAKAMTAKSPTCSLAHGALSAMGFHRGPYDYVTSSPTRRLQVSADFVGMFTDHNPSADALISYLAGRKAQQFWVNQRGGYAFSADSRVTGYDDPVQRRIAEMLRPNSRYTLCFSAADAMRPDVSAAFYRAVLGYAAEDPPGTPSSLLAALDDVQEKLGNSQVSPGRLCNTLT
jgi:alpha-glucoside transport system substrate-binding protein